uniref:Uncharacterized protein n=1 Tax=Strongyloides venezuelensis TaxID=75913 RepID=A0A0K0G671_STRVS
MLLSNHIKQYILFIFSISIIELVKFSLPAESPTISRNGRRNSGSRGSLSPSRQSTTKTRDKAEIETLIINDEIYLNQEYDKVFDADGQSNR